MKRSFTGVPVAAFAALVGLLACTPDSTLTGAASVRDSLLAAGGANALFKAPAAVKSITVVLGAAQIKAGVATTATATMRDGASNLVTDRSPIWTSSNAAVATVDARGTVTAVAPGVASIIATSGGVSGSSTVTVVGVAISLAITTQPASATSGVTFPSAIVVQVRDAAGAAVVGATNVVTASVVSGGGVLGGTISVTAVNGVATFSALQIAGAGAQTLQFATPGLTAATSGAIVVSGAAAPLAADGSTEPSEPVYDGATQLSLFKDEFDQYTDFQSAIAGGWLGVNGMRAQDYSTNPSGANQIIAPGYDNRGKAFRLVYDGVANAGGQEGHSFSWVLGDTLAAKPGHAFYVSYYFRVTGGRGLLVDNSAQDIIKVKWLMLWNHDGSHRAQFSTGYQTCWNNVPATAPYGGTIWQFLGGPTEPPTCMAGQVRGPFMYQGQASWHRLTFKYVTNSRSGARDGIGQAWYDGTLIVNVAANACGVIVPGAVGAAAGKATWCAMPDVDYILTQERVSYLTFGSVSTSGLWPFTIDIDHLSMWRDR